MSDPWKDPEFFKSLMARQHRDMMKFADALKKIATNTNDQPECVEIARNALTPD